MKQEKKETILLPVQCERVFTFSRRFVDRSPLVKKKKKKKGKKERKRKKEKSKGQVRDIQRLKGTYGQREDHEGSLREATERKSSRVEG